MECAEWTRKCVLIADLEVNWRKVYKPSSKNKNHIRSLVRKSYDRKWHLRHVNHSSKIPCERDQQWDASDQNNVDKKAGFGLIRTNKIMTVTADCQIKCRWTYCSLYGVITTTYLAHHYPHIMAAAFNLLALIVRGAEAWNGSCGGFEQMPAQIMFTGLSSQTTKT